VNGVDLLDWAAPGPYRVAFSTRLGGVSEAEFASLNLGILTEDDPARVVVNRTRLCEAVDADPDGATMAWQRHGGTVTRAQPRGIITPGTVYDHCDGLWSDAPGRAMLLLTADCMPIAIARSDGIRPAVEILHAGWRGLLAEPEAFVSAVEIEQLVAAQEYWIADWVAFAGSGALADQVRFAREWGITWHEEPVSSADL